MDQPTEAIRRLVASVSGDPARSLELVVDWLHREIRAPSAPRFFAALRDELGCDFNAPGFDRLLDQALDVSGGVPDTGVVHEALDPRENPTARSVAEQAFIAFLRPVGEVLDREIRRWNAGHEGA